MEQNTLRGLWDQFSVAANELGKVIETYRDISHVLPSLVKQKEALAIELVELENVLAEGKARVQKELSEYRAALETDVESLQRAAAEARERTAKAIAERTAAEEAATARKGDINNQIKALEARRLTLEEAIREFRKKHDL